jgi:hypothetical protein
MSTTSPTPVCTLLQLIADELGRATADELGRSVDQALDQLDAPQEPHTRSERTAKLAPHDQLLIWGWLWDQFAEMAPSRFLLAPKRLGERNAAATAFLWARARDPHLTRLELTDDEHAEVSFGRSLLRRWTGLRTLRPCSLWQAGAQSAMAAIPAYYGAVAWSYAQVPVLRRQVVVSEEGLRTRRIGGSPEATVAAVILHEELHAAYAAAARPGQLLSRSNQTAWKFDEALVRAAEAAVLYCLLTDEEPTAGMLHDWASETGFNTAMLPLLEPFADNTPPGEFLRVLTECSIAASRCNDSDAAENIIADRLGVSDGTWHDQLTRAAA